MVNSLFDLYLPLIIFTGVFLGLFVGMIGVMFLISKQFREEMKKDWDKK